MLRRLLMVLLGAFLLFPGGLRAGVQLPQTGQTGCWDESGKLIDCLGTGQDGDSRAGVPWPEPRFTVQGECLADNLTGLMWPRNGNLAGKAGSWQAALAFANNLQLCGYSDWRLPNINELESLVNVEQANSAEWLNDVQGFTGVRGLTGTFVLDRPYWSSTAAPSGSSSARKILSIQMVQGAVGFSASNGTGYVWPVRSGPSTGVIQLPATGQVTSYAAGDDGDLNAGAAWPRPRFSDRGNGEVADNLTGLVWTKNADLLASDPDYAGGNSGASSWQQALNYVKKLNTKNYLGHSDWRLPNRKELLSLIDRSQDKPALPVNHPFSNVQSYDKYWSSTTNKKTLIAAWAIDMSFGGSSPACKDVGCLPNHVWPVRGGVDLPGKLEISPGAYRFGASRQGACSTPQVFTLANTGEGPLILADISLSDSANYHLDATGGMNPCIKPAGYQTLRPGGFCTVSVAFCPATSGTVNADLNITSNAPDSPATVSMTGLSSEKGWLVIIDGMNPLASFYPGWQPTPPMYLYNAIPPNNRKAINSAIGYIYPFSWSTNIDDTDAAVLSLTTLLKELSAYNKQNNTKLVLLSHSWGSLISYLSINTNRDIHVDKFITMGSPLNSTGWQRYDYTLQHLKAYNSYPLAKQVNINKWHNYYALYDSISSQIPVADMNSKDSTKYFGLTSIQRLWNAHSSYYNNPQIWNKILTDIATP